MNISYVDVTAFMWRLFIDAEMLQKALLCVCVGPCISAPV